MTSSPAGPTGTVPPLPPAQRSRPRRARPPRASDQAADTAAVRPAWSEPSAPAPPALGPAVAQLVGLLLHAEGAPARGLLLDCTVAGVRLIVTRVPERVATATAALSPRELEIARMVGLGHTNKRIAAVLDISGWTVSAHLRRIFDKLGVSSRAAMVRVLTEDPGLSWPELPAPRAPEEPLSADGA